MTTASLDTGVELDITIGARFGRYHVLGSLGAGGVGEVFRAEDVELGRTVALKVLHRSRPSHVPGLTRAGAARILQEARAAATIHHPNAVVVFDADEHAGVPYLVMELVPGTTLRAFVGDPEVHVAAKIAWLIDIARALDAAHRKGIIHRDIKPENVMLRDDGVIKVLDFGIARRVSDGEPPSPGDRAEGVYGTPAYMAPERLSGEDGDALTDQFAWGVLAYELVTGDHPWETKRGTLELARDMARRDPAPPSARAPDVPCAIDDVLLRALSKRPTDRFASMDDAWSALRAASRVGEGPSAKRRFPQRSRWPQRAFVGSLALAGIFALAVLVVRSTRRDYGPASLHALPAAPLPLAFGSTMSTNAAAVAAYVAGIDAIHNAARSVARKHFDEAIRLDPSFAAGHLRRVLSAGEIGDGERESLRKATQLRDALSEHDRALLRAIGPWLTVPEDVPEVERRLAAVSAAHPDADNLYHLCRFRMLAGQYRGAIEACRASREVDATFAGAYAIEAQSYLFLDESAAGRRALDACVRISPDSTSCINELLQLQLNEGSCDAAYGYAQKLAALQPDSAGWFEQLGIASYATRKPLPQTRAAFERWWSLSPADKRPLLRAVTDSQLAVVTGYLEGALDDLDAITTLIDESGQEALRVEALMFRVRYLREVGDEARGNERARAFLNSQAGMSQQRTNRAGIEAAIALYRGAGISRREWLGMRAEWLAKQNALPTAPGRFADGSGRRWIWAYAHAVVTRQDAQDALVALPSYLPLPPGRRREADDDEAIGRTYLLAGQSDEATPFLRRATRSCLTSAYPFEHTWAHLELGQALESTDVPGACAAYQVVLDRWGAAPASRSARAARARRKALHCP